MTTAKQRRFRRMLFAGRQYSSVEWAALARFLFPDLNGVRQKVEYYCSACDKAFHSLATPTKCPHCVGEAAADPQAVRLAHKEYTAGTFPFFIPEDSSTK